MSESLVLKHKNSLALTEHKLLQKQSESKNCFQHVTIHKITVFCIITGCIFLIYWFVLCPLLLNLVYHHNKMSTVWLVSYWVVAFLIWLFLMLCLVLVWKCINSKQTDKIKSHSYGTSNSMTPSSLVSVKSDPSQNLKFTSLKEDESTSTLISDNIQIKSDTKIINTNNSDELEQSKSKKHKDLPPLVIHRRKSGNIKDTANIKLKNNIDEDDEDEDMLKSGNDISKCHRNSIKDYLKLVTITPNDEVDVKSPKESLSPRELFFIDLIKAAEEADKNKEGGSANVTAGKHFFPSDFSPTDKGVVENAKNETKSVEIPASSSGHESTYFIANIDSPKYKKTEVYLDVNPDLETIARQSVNLTVKEPIVTPKYPTDNEDENDNAKEKVVIFEV
ncbi:uncharacterized protein LOC143175308 [Nomia melanderi]|uniref:uncharacterized protein LOC143175308 n=1 Tax=Nomia melanderi TaxID=2448451 RepID=UPI003FCD4452